VAERIGQAGCFLIPFFYRIRLKVTIEYGALGIMILLMGVYYCCWIRYMILGRKEELLYTSMCGIPIPMALTPVFYYLVASIMLRSLWLLISSAVFGVAHITISWLSSKEVIKNKNNRC